ncbi:MAG: translation initiation factor IF-2 subunit gamma [Candidatus Diapherotrites archaeon]|nr:translation initiation factor IF-2 subunit gamma [Candidatus Diapherotrites archaeon]MDZ4256286.1 translation initiation factor IF-2 subunit gamma [archaeon]
MKPTTKTSKEKNAPGPHQAEINIGLIGHVDHGKTSLTQALSGKWTDTHSEELKRGISIRLGYADTTFYEYPGIEGVAKYGVAPEKDGVKGKIRRKVSFIDAPGHETLMTTMLSGAALMQGALLVVAANEKCPQPRTAEHLLALQIGGITHIVVVQNKVDLVPPERAQESHAEIVQFLKDYGYENVPIIPISATFNVNIDALIEAIETYIPTPPVDEKKPFRMYISRSFDVNRPGTEISQIKGGVLGGSIVQGLLSKGQEVEITPGIDGKPFRIHVDSIHIAEGELKTAHPGGLIAVGTLLDPGITSMDKFKGQILSAPGSMPAPTETFTMEWHELPRLLGEKLPFPHVHELLVLTIGTHTQVGEIVSIKKNTFHLKLKGKMPVEEGQKIAISRRDKAAWRLGGWGIVH